MSGFHSASDYIKLAFCLVVGTFVTLVVIFFTPYWTVDPPNNGYAGLWQACSNNICYDRWNMWVEEWVKATQAFVILSLICTGWELFMTTLFIFHRDYEADKRFIFLCVFGSFATTLFMFLAVCIWGGGQYLDTGETLSWCFAFANFLVLSSAVSGVMYLLELRAPVQLGEDQQNLLEKVASMPVQADRLFVEFMPEQGNNPLDLTADYGPRNLNMSMKSGLNTSSSVYQSKQPLS